MNLTIDCREKDLINKINHLIENIPIFNTITVESTNLPLGDISINEKENIKLLIERKSVSDLISSIKDGRYEEQSFRLNSSEIPNHNIIYLIEGDFRKINQFQKTSFEKLTLYSTVLSLNYYKGFSVIRTFDLEETAIFILNSFNKINKQNNDRIPYYSLNTCLNENITSKDYVNVIKKVKKENVTPENINEIMLCQIPGISSITAKAILKKFISINNIILSLKEDNSCMLDISVDTKNGKSRKINKKTGEILMNYLIH